MSKILQSGNSFFVRPDSEAIAYDTLPVGTYTIKFNEREGHFYLNKVEDFTLPSKIYGKNTNYADRILSTFKDRPLTTGVLLSGVKGSGKTLLTKQVANLAATQGIPTIVINFPWHGDEFNSFIQSIDSPAVILFDEFEKVYDYTKQQKILTLLDGVFPTKKLFLLTTNDTSGINSFLQNRPGRIFYNFEYDSLGQEFIKEYCEDCLDNKDMIDDVLKYTSIFTFFNFDMLAATVEEMNRYGETLTEVLDVLNIKPETSEWDTYEMKLSVNGAEYILDKSYRGFQPTDFQYVLWVDDYNMPMPLKSDPELTAFLRQSADTDDDDGTTQDHIVFRSEILKSYDQTQKVFTYEMNRNGTDIQLKAKRNDTGTAWKFNPLAI